MANFSRRMDDGEAALFVSGLVVECKHVTFPGMDALGLGATFKGDQDLADAVRYVIAARHGSNIQRGIVIAMLAYDIVDAGRLLSLVTGGGR